MKLCTGTAPESPSAPAPAPASPGIRPDVLGFGDRHPWLPPTLAGHPLPPLRDHTVPRHPPSPLPSGSGLALILSRSHTATGSVFSSSSHLNIAIPKYDFQN